MVEEVEKLVEALNAARASARPGSLWRKVSDRDLAEAAATLERGETDATEWRLTALAQEERAQAAEAQVEALRKALEGADRLLATFADISDSDDLEFVQVRKAVRAALSAPAEERGSSRDLSPAITAVTSGQIRSVCDDLIAVAEELGEHFDMADGPCDVDGLCSAWICQGAGCIKDKADRARQLAAQAEESAVYPPQDIATVRDWLRELPSLDMEDIAADGGVTVAMVVQQQAGEMAARLERALREISAKAAGEQE